MALQNYLFGTAPAVIHNPAESPLWNRIVDRCLQPKCPRQPLRNLTIFTVDNCDPESDSYNWARHSLSRLGANCVLLGQGLPSENWCNRRKIDLYLKALAVTKTQYVMGVDAYDAVFVSHPNALPARMRNHFPDASMVFGGTMRVYGFKISNDWEKNMFSDELYGHMNAGMWIARTDFCKHFFSVAKKLLPLADHFVARIKDPVRRAEMLCSEQSVLKLAFALLYPKTVIDHRCRLFQNIANLEHLPESAGRFKHDQGLRF